MPKEVVNREHEPIDILIEHVDGSAVSGPQLFAGDEHRQLQVGLSLQLWEFRLASKRRLVSVSRLINPSEDRQRCRPVDVCLRMIEGVSHRDVSVQQLKRNERISGREHAGLNAKILRLAARTTELLFKAAGYISIPLLVPERVISHELPAGTFCSDLRVRRRLEDHVGDGRDVVTVLRVGGESLPLRILEE